MEIHYDWIHSHSLHWSFHFNHSHVQILRRLSMSHESILHYIQFNPRLYSHLFVCPPHRARAELSVRTITHFDGGDLIDLSHR